MGNQTGSSDPFSITPPLPDVSAEGYTLSQGTASAAPASTQPAPTPPTAPAGPPNPAQPATPMGAAAPLPSPAAGEFVAPAAPAQPAVPVNPYGTPTLPPAGTVNPYGTPVSAGGAPPPGWSGGAAAQGAALRYDGYGIASVALSILLPIIAIPLAIAALVRISRGKRRGKGLAWVGLGLSVLTIAGVVAILTTDNPVHDYINEQIGAASNPQLKIASDACKAGDMAQCDRLAEIAKPGTSFYKVADTCGDDSGVAGQAGSCVAAANAQSQGTDTYAPVDYPASFDGFFATLVSECQGGNMTACDLIFYMDPADDAVYQVGYDCGGDTAAAKGESCSGADPSTDEGWAQFIAGLRDLNLPAPGANDTWDTLWVSCAAGTMGDCDTLLGDVVSKGDVSYIYRVQASTCGFTDPESDDYCAAG